MFDPRDPYERYWWHYDSRRPLSMAQIIAMKSVDVETVALIWMLLEHGASLTVAGPTDPQPGIGKTTTLNALLQFLPEGTALAYMSGMYENFAFTQLPDIDPAAIVPRLPTLRTGMQPIRSPHDHRTTRRGSGTLGVRLA